MTISMRKQTVLRVLSRLFHMFYYMYAIINVSVTDVQFIQRDVWELRASGFAPGDLNSCHKLFIKIVRCLTIHLNARMGLRKYEMEIFC